MGGEKLSIPQLQSTRVFDAPGIQLPVLTFKPSIESRENGIPHNCGIAGVYDSNGDIAIYMEIMLSNLNHRGQEGAGLVIVGKNKDYIYKGKGLVNEVIDSENDIPKPPAIVSLKQLQKHKGRIAIGQDRYSTSGEEDAWQPFYDPKSRFGLAHNGNFVNVDQMLEMVPEEKRAEAVSDSWVAHQAILHAEGKNWEEKITSATSQFDGAYSLVMQSKTQLFGVRDPWGMKPLFVGQLPTGGYILASESCVLEDLDAKFVRDVEPGEGVVIDKNGINTFFVDARRDIVNGAFCSFEYIYIARPDSYINGRSVQKIRHNLGRTLARHDKEAGLDMSNVVVVGVQDSGTIYAQGYADEAKLSQETGLFRNHYAAKGRVFQYLKSRKAATNRKHSADAFSIEDKDVLVIDDSIVRNTTMPELVRKLQTAHNSYPWLKPPRSINVRIAFPLISFPCYYGVDFSTIAELANHSHTSNPVEEIRKDTGADTLSYISVYDLVEAITGKEVDRNLSGAEVLCMNKLCGHCITGVQPIPVREEGLKRKKNGIRRDMS